MRRRCARASSSDVDLRLERRRSRRRGSCRSRRCAARRSARPCAISLAAKISCRCRSTDRGSWSRRRRGWRSVTQFCCGMMPSVPIAPCQCTSIRPGMIVLPVASIDLARRPGRATLARGPTAAMRLPSTTTVPSSITSSPRMVTMRAADERERARRARRLRRRSRCRSPVAGGSGSFSGAPSRKAKASLSSRVKSSGPSDQWSRLRVARPVQVLAGVAATPSRPAATSSSGRSSIALAGARRTA